MRGQRTWAVGLATVAVLALMPAGAEAFHDAALHVGVRAWFPTLSGEVASTKGGLAGDLITDKDLDLDAPDVTPGGEATLRLGRHTFRVEGFALSVSGDTRVSRSFAFAGRTYSVTSRVTSDADVTFLAADYGFDLVHQGPLALAVTVGGRLVSTKATLRAPDLGFEGRGSFDAAVPAVGAVLTLHPFPVPLLSSLAVVGRVSGLTIGDRGTVYDVDGGAEWAPFPFLSLWVGYRFLHGQGEQGGDRAKFDLSGPYLGATLAF